MKSKEMDLNFWPANYRVIGWGDSTGDLIEDIRASGYDGLQADVIHVGDSLIPTDEDEMIIVLCTEIHDGLEGLLNTFHQAGVLTIVVSVEPLNITYDAFDSLAVVPRYEITGVVRTILNPIFLKGCLSYDFNDVDYTLRDTKRFITLSVYGKGENRMNDAVTSLSEHLDTVNGIEILSLIIRFNESKLDPPMLMEELSSVTGFIGRFPESLNVLWAILDDAGLDGSTIGLSVIASGKELITVNRHND